MQNAELFVDCKVAIEEQSQCHVILMMMMMMMMMMIFYSLM
jgi:hypothetical protein